MQNAPLKVIGKCWDWKNSVNTCGIELNKIKCINLLLSLDSKTGGQQELVQIRG